MNSSRRYIVISPVRNEADYLPAALASMRAQTVRPTLWILVDDGSTDNTSEVITEAARQDGYVRLVRRGDRGFREAGGGVINAFYDGFSQIGSEPWDYLVKLDGDVSFTPDYFECCLRKFEESPRLGIGGGTISAEVNGQLVPESTVDPAFHVRGATKIYRRECWDAIGGLIRAPGWDTVDELKANMLGWTTLTFADIPIHHHRPTGKAYGTWKDWTKNGRANYVAGYHPLFMAVKCVKRLADKPYLISSIGLAWGYVAAWCRRVPQVDDAALLRYFRQQQMNRLMMRKSLWT